jgi:hypothetical protein
MDGVCHLCMAGGRCKMILGGGVAAGPSTKRAKPTATDTTLSVGPRHHSGFFNTSGIFHEKRDQLV